MPDFNYHWERFWSHEGFEAQNDDFLPDPHGWLGNKRLVTFEQIRDMPCLILLGSPGAGKSYALQDMAEQTMAQGHLHVLEKLIEYSDADKLFRHIEKNPNFGIWRDGEQTLHLFLDSLDEGRLEVKRLEHELQHYFQELPANRLCVRITCRAAELPHDFQELMEQIWPRKDDREPPQVSVLHLVQLREQDVYQAADQRKAAGRLLDPDEFMVGIKRTHIEALAAHPITLNMLFRIYEAEGQLPTNRKDAYERGCKLLAAESNRNRTDDGVAEDLNVDRRLDAARQVAAVTIIGNRPRITSSPEPVAETGVARLEDCYLAQQSVWNNPAALLRETVQTALFTASAYQTYGWAHRSYGEYLAAAFVVQAQMPLAQIKSLLINPVDPDGGIAPKLQETAAWLADARLDVFDWIFESDPLVLVKSKSIQLTEQQKTVLVELLIKQYASQEIPHERLDWNDLKQLCHPTLNLQLTQYLSDKQLSFRARDLAFNFADACRVEGIDDVFIALALDPQEDIHLRKNALATLNRTKRQRDQIKAIKPLVLHPDEFRADGDMVAEAMDILFPEHLTARELFKRLHLQSDEQHVIGSPQDKLLRDDLIDRLSESDLIIVLDWVTKNDRMSGRDLSIAGNDFILQIMRRGWDHFDNENVRLAFARAAWQRIINFNGVFIDRYSVSQPDRDYGSELHSDSEKRHQLLHTMLAVLSAENPQNEKMLVQLIWRDGGLVCVIVDDVPWLVEQAHTDVAAKESLAYVQLVKSLIRSNDVPLSIAEWLYAGYQTRNYPLIQDYLHYLFDPVAVDSDTAKAGRETFSFRRRERERVEEQQKRDAEFRANILEWLTKCEEDSANWWVVSQYLVGHWSAIDIRKGQGWKLFSDDVETRLRFVLVALRYIKEQNPYIGDVEPDAPIMNRYPAIEGYRALLLLGNMNLFGQLTPEDWQRWADAIAFNVYAKEQEVLALDDQLLKSAFQYASESLLERLEKTIKHDKERYVQNFLIRFRYAPEDSLNRMLLQQLHQLKPEAEQFDTILQFLLQRDDRTSHEAQAVATVYLKILPEDEIGLAGWKRIVRTLAFSAQDGSWWSDVWSKLSADQIFAETVLKLLGDHHNNPLFRHLSEPQLYDLYLLALQVYRLEDDIEFHGGFVPERYSRQEWRDSILREIAGRGTESAVRIF